MYTGFFLNVRDIYAIHIYLHPCILCIHLCLSFVQSFFTKPAHAASLANAYIYLLVYIRTSLVRVIDPEILRGETEELLVILW